MHGEPRGPTDERAQSSTLGVALIIGLTLTAAMTIVVFGSAAISDSQQDSQLGQAEQALTQFDARTSQVALGDSSVQRVDFGQSGGIVRVDENAGSVRLYHEDWSDSHPDEEITNGPIPLGAVMYELDGTTIAYQGGGVWRQDANGGSTMISQPEIHKRSATLTFPIITVRGEGSGSGRQAATVRRASGTQPIFPDYQGDRTPLADQYDGSPIVYNNPVSSGNMTIEVESQFCEAWRSYFAQRTEGLVSDCVDDTVTAQILALGAQGAFEIDGNQELFLRGVESLETLELVIEESESQQGTWSSLDWSMYGEADDAEFEIHFGSSGNLDCGDSATLTVSFSNDTWDHTWTNDEDFVLDTIDDIDCEDAHSQDRLYFTANLLSESTQMTGDGDTSPFGASEPLDVIIREYFEIMLDADGNFDMEIEEGNNAQISDTSSGSIEYDGSGQVVTFLHVTENEVEVSLD